MLPFSLQAKELSLNNKNPLAARELALITMLPFGKGIEINYYFSLASKGIKLNWTKTKCGYGKIPYP